MVMSDCFHVHAVAMETYLGGFFNPLVTWFTLDLEQSANKTVTVLCVNERDRGPDDEREAIGQPHCRES